MCTPSAQLVSELKVKDVRFITGENDAGLDGGEMYQHIFRPGQYSFKQKEAHFVALGNVSDPNGPIGEQQLEWLHAELAGLDKTASVVAFVHRPLFDT